MEPRTCPGCGADYRPRTAAEVERCWSCAGLGFGYVMTTSPGGGDVRPMVERAGPRKLAAADPVSRTTLLDALDALGV